MVYNALKLFMEINPDLFDESMHQYKQRKIEYVVIPSYPISFTQLLLDREQQHAVGRYDAWEKMRTTALRNTGGKLPDGYMEIPYPLPPPPPSAEDVDILDLSMELNAASIDDVGGDLDDIERVPMADPGLDVR